MITVSFFFFSFFNRTYSVDSVVVNKDDRRVYNRKAKSRPPSTRCLVDIKIKLFRSFLLHCRLKQYNYDVVYVEESAF